MNFVETQMADMEDCSQPRFIQLWKRPLSLTLWRFLRAQAWEQILP